MSNIEALRTVDALKGSMKSSATIAPEKKKSVHALEATNFFLADVQTGLGPFLAAYLAGAGWKPGRVGTALTIGGIITVALQAPAGAIVDQLRSKRLILVVASAVVAAGAVLLSLTAAPWAVYSSQVLIGGAGPFLGPTLAAVTMESSVLPASIVSLGRISRLTQPGTSSVRF